MSLLIKAAIAAAGIATAGAVATVANIALSFTGRTRTAPGHWPR